MAAESTAMPFYRDKDALGRSDDVLVVEDATMLLLDESGYWRPTFRYARGNIIKAHPLIIDALLENAEPLWSLEELLGEVEAGGRRSP